MLISYPHQMLALPCGEVPDEMFDASLATMVERLHEVRRSCSIVGASAVALAGPQVGFPLRLFVWGDDGGEDRAVVNPVLVEAEGYAYGEEGCLSLLGPLDEVTRVWRAGLSLQVRRAERVLVRGRHPDGGALEVEASGFMARVLQHELDHLDGKLILDRVSRPVAKQALKRWRSSSWAPRREITARDLAGRARSA